MIDEITINDVPYSQTPDTNQQYVGWYRNGEKPLSGGDADGDYKGILNRPVWHLYNNIDTIDSNVSSITVKLNETIIEVNSLRDLFEGIEDYTDLITQVNGISTRVSTLEGNYTTLSDRIETLETNYSSLFDTVNTLSNNYTTLSSTVSSNNDSIGNIANDIGERNSSDTRNLDIFSDLYLIREDIGNYLDYDIFGNVSLGNPASGVKARVDSIATAVNENETAIESSQTDIQTLQEQVGSDVLGSESGLELRTKVLEGEQRRMLAYGGLRLSVNSAETTIANAGTYVPMNIDETVAMSVNRNVSTQSQDTIVAGRSGAYFLNADVLINSSLSNVWVQLEIYQNGLPTGINTYCRLHEDGRGFISMSEPLQVTQEDEISLRITLQNTTGVVVIEDFSMFIAPM